ncbi:hypothetical protein [Streptomyces xanthophaeus]|uniref:hypothetical protein n=1 Tax=Streptomyces xanthophaeus TaxID=67385 RepID=UPI0026489051|nr:hypothetical protein [Streptomyces xanthophaeus]WKD33243.1 hypothetical protein KO717_15565 [Streptomyces xanthophaeus]
MRLPRENIDLPEDRGCLQWVLGIPLALSYVPAVFTCYVALSIGPDPHDDLLREDVRFLTGCCLVLCLVGLLITITPLFRRTMGRWWFALPFLLATVAYVRGQTV